MSKVELKPCPFCGSDRVRIPYVDGENANTINCLNCNMLAIFFEQENLKDEQLAGLWNKRTDEKHEVWNIDYDDIVCSECGTVFNLNDNDTENFNFCPNCGAKMREQITNYEKIKNMTVEEMVEFIICEGACNYCIYADDDNCKGAKCKEGVTAWLNQEADDD